MYLHAGLLRSCRLPLGYSFNSRARRQLGSRRILCNMLVPLQAAERNGAHPLPHVVGPPDRLAVHALLVPVPPPAAARV
jgi:hypothetical protein